MVSPGVGVKERTAPHRPSLSTGLGEEQQLPTTADTDQPEGKQKTKVLQEGQTNK